METRKIWTPSLYCIGCFWIWRLLFYDLLKFFPITYFDWFCDVFIIYMRILFRLLCRKWFQSIPKFWRCWSAWSFAKSCKYTWVQYTRSFKYTCFQCKLVLFSIYLQQRENSHWERYYIINDCLHHLPFFSVSHCQPQNADHRYSYFMDYIYIYIYIYLYTI